MRRYTTTHRDPTPIVNSRELAISALASVKDISVDLIDSDNLYGLIKDGYLVPNDVLLSRWASKDTWVEVHLEISPSFIAYWVWIQII